MTLSALIPSTLTPWRDDRAPALAGWSREVAQPSERVHFLHGNGFCSATLWPVAQHLPQDWSLYFTDLPGHGGSEQPNDAMPDWRAMARRIGDALALRTQGQPVVGVGHSIGGMLTLLLASERPELFSRIILLDPIFFSPGIQLAQATLRHTGLWSRMRLVTSVQKRRQHWPDQQALHADLRGKSLYRHWDDLAFECFVAGATVARENGVSLACNPMWEANIFGSYPRKLWAAVKQLAVPTELYVARKSFPFIVKSAQRAARINGHIVWQYSEGTHCYPLETPQLAANQIISALAR